MKKIHRDFSALFSNRIDHSCERHSGVAWLRVNTGKVQEVSLKIYIRKAAGDIIEDCATRR